MSEETTAASRKAARGVWTSVALSGIFGWILLLALTFAVPNVTGTLGAGAFDVQYIWQHSLGSKWAEFLLFVVVVAQFFCDNANITSSSRIIWALSRDRAVPGHHLWHRLNPAPRSGVRDLAGGDLRHPVDAADLRQRRRRVPGRHVDHGHRPVQRLRHPDLPAGEAGRRFERGAWTLGPHYRWVDAVALTWIVIIAILFIMPVTAGRHPRSMPVSPGPS